MYCTKCGKELFDEAIMCPQCGTPSINAENPTENIASTDEFKPTRNPDVKILYYVGEIGEKFPLKLNIEFGNFYFEDNCLIVESFASNARVKTGTIKVNYSDIRIKKLISKQMLINKLRVLVFYVDDFVFSVYAPDGFMGKQIDKSLSSAAQGSMDEFNATLSKLEKIENMLSERIGDF